MKNILMTLCLIGLLLTTSCTENDHLVPENETSAKLTHDELQKQIQNVKSINQKFENELNQKFFGSIDTKTLMETAKKNNSSVVTNETIESSLIAYHKMRLEKTKRMRNEMGFTSIQSIADEINSLLIIDKDLADKLFNENALVLEKNQFGVSAKIDSELASVVDKDGSVFNLNKKIDLSLSENSQSRVAYQFNQGILVSNGIYAVTWHAEYWERGGIHLDFQKYKHETRIGTYFNWNGTYILYPSVITIWNGYHQFNKTGLCLGANSKGVSYASGVWVTDTFNSESDTQPYPYLCNGYINGDFATIVGNNQLVYLTANTAIQ